MANITAAQIQAAGGWSTTEAPDATLALAPYILAGDGWLNKILSEAGYASLTALTTADANAGALALAAEIFFVAHLFAARPAKEDFQAGPVRSDSPRGKEVTEQAEYLLKKAKEMLSLAGLSTENWEWDYAGGDDYHPDGADDTNIDFGIVDSDDEFFLIGGDAT